MEGGGIGSGAPFLAMIAKQVLPLNATKDNSTTEKSFCVARKWLRDVPGIRVAI